jgi:hypothetical protein
MQHADVLAGVRQARMPAQSCLLADMHACFERNWALVPEEEKEYLRGCILAMREGGRLSPQALHRAGLARREQYLKQMERNELPSAPRSLIAPSGETLPAPDIRIRRL